MLEGEATRRLRKALEQHPRLKEHKALIIRHVSLYTAGVFDLSVSIGQFTLWIELKMLGRKLTALQAYNLKLLRRGGCVVTFSKDGKHAVVSNIEAMGWLDTKTELVEEIVARCCDNGIVQSGAA